MKFQVAKFLQRRTANPDQPGRPSETPAPRNHLLFSIPRLPDPETSPERQRPVPVSINETESHMQAAPRPLETQSSAPPAHQPPIPTSRWSVRRNAHQARADIRRKNILLMLSCIGAVVGIFVVFESRRPSSAPKVTAKQEKRTKPASPAVQPSNILRLPEEESGPVLPNLPTQNDGSTAQKSLPTAQPIIPVAGDTLLQPYQRRVKWAHHSQDASNAPQGIIQNVGGQSLISPTPNWAPPSRPAAPPQR